jgi:hypothetical protein
VSPWVICKEEEKESREEEEKGSLGRNSFEFRKIQNLIQEVVVVC